MALMDTAPPPANAPGAAAARGTGGNVNQPYLAAGKAPAAPPGSAGSAGAAALYGPQQQALNAANQYYTTQQALAGQQFGQASSYANQQYNTATQGLGLDQQDINLQQQGLGSDRRYYGQSRGININNYRNDINYDIRQRAIANQLYNAMMKGYNIQGGPNGTISQQLQEALGQVAAQKAQAHGQYTDASQQLAQQVAAAGATGARGVGQRQGFLGGTLENTLAGLTQQGLAAHTQFQTQNAQLGQSIAQTLEQKQRMVSLANRRQVAAQLGIQQANADYQHLMAGNSISSQRLGVQAARLGVSKQQYADALHNAVASAGLQYDSGLASSNYNLAQLVPQQQSLWFNQLNAANYLNQPGYGSDTGYGAQGLHGPMGP